MSQSRGATAKLYLSLLVVKTMSGSPWADAGYCESTATESRTLGAWEALVSHIVYMRYVL